MLQTAGLRTALGSQQASGIQTQLPAWPPHQNAVKSDTCSVTCSDKHLQIHASGGKCVQSKADSNTTGISAALADLNGANDDSRCACNTLGHRASSQDPGDLVAGCLKTCKTQEDPHMSGPICAANKVRSCGDRGFAVR